MKKNSDPITKYIIIGIAVALIGMVVYDAHLPSDSDKRPRVEKKTRKAGAKKKNAAKSSADEKITVEEAVEKLKAYEILGTSRTDKISSHFLHHFMLYKDGEEDIKDYPYVDKIIEMFYETNRRWKAGEYRRLPVKFIEAFLDKGCTIADARKCCERVRDARPPKDDKLMSLMLRQLVKYAPDQINTPDDYSRETPLMYAAQYSSAEICKLLLDAGANANARDKRERTPLMYAAQYSSAETCKYLIEAGADVNAKNKDGWPPLRYAKSAEICKLLVNAGADVNAKDEDGQTLSMWVGSDNLKVLIAAGANINGGCLHKAVYFGNVEECKILIEAGADVNEKIEGLTPIWGIVKRMENNEEGYAKIKENPDLKHVYNLVEISDLKEMCKLLISAGADVNARDEYGDTPLMMALNKTVSPENEEMCQTFIACGADVNARSDNDGETPLMYIRGDASINLLMKLIKAGADVNAKDNDGRTVLMHYCEFRENLIEPLILAGADVNAKDNNGNTAYYYARNDRVRAILKKYVAK